MCLFAIKHFVDANINNKAKKSLYVKTSEFEICKIIKSLKTQTLLDLIIFPQNSSNSPFPY